MNQINNFYNYAKIFEYTMNDSTTLEELKTLNNFIVSKKKNQSIELKFFLDNIELDLLNKLFLDFKNNTKVIINFLHKKKQLYYFDFFYKNYFFLYKQKHNIKNMDIYSSTPITNEEKNKLLAYFNKVYNSNFIVVNKIDKNLLMGIKIQIEDKCYDDSLYTKLRKLI